MFQTIPDLPIDFQEHIKKIVTKKGYVKYDLKITNLNTGGDNFLGSLYEVDIKGDTGNKKKETNLFVKVIINLQNINLICVENLYINEMFFYNDLSKMFKVLQDEAKIPVKERYNIVKSFDETNSHVIILENLNRKGFKTYNRFDVMPLKFAELAIQQLAKFHGMSFVMEIKMPEFYNNKIKTIKHPFNYNDDYRAVNGEAVEVVPIDYQLMDYGCPIRDFLFFIFTATDQEFRRKHLQDLKEMYFETLSQFLKHFDIDVEEVYPKKEFERVYSKWLDFGLIKFMFSAVILYTLEKEMDLKNLSLSELPFNFSSDFEERAGGLVDDFIKWGCL